MKLTRLRKKIALAAGLGVALSFVPIGLSAAGCTSKSAANSSSIPMTPQASDIVIEWNERAANLTLTAVPALAPVEQTRVMAVLQMARHDAVNAITSE